jgi:predicted ATPase
MSAILWDRLQHILLNRKKFPSVEHILALMSKAVAKKHSIHSKAIAAITVLDQVLFADCLTSSLDKYTFIIKVQETIESEALITTTFEHSKKRITITFFETDFHGRVDGRRCHSKDLCFTIAMTHEITHILEFLVRAELSTRFGYRESVDDSENPVFKEWYRQLFGGKHLFS